MCIPVTSSIENYIFRFLTLVYPEICSRGSGVSRLIASIIHPILPLKVDENPEGIKGGPLSGELTNQYR